MKKLLLSLVAAFTLLVSGCACSKEGVYKFHSIITVEDGEEKLYDCTKPDTLEEEVATVCELFAGLEVELGKEWATMRHVADGKTEELNKEQYKIEDNKIMIKNEETGAFDQEMGRIDWNKLYIPFEEGSDTKIIFKK